MTTSFRILCYAKSTFLYVYMQEQATVQALIDFSFSYCFTDQGLGVVGCWVVVLLTPTYPDTYTAFATNAY